MGDSGSVNLDVSSWQQAYAFIGGSLKNINDSIRITSNTIIRLDKQINKYKIDLRNLGSRKTHASKTIEIDVLLDRPLAFDLMIKYNIRGASWKPLYDARLDNDSSVQMVCYADITQTTGENWEDVALTISTAMPSKGTSPGELLDWYISVFMPREKKQTVNDLGKYNTERIESASRICS